MSMLDHLAYDYSWRWVLARCAIQIIASFVGFLVGFFLVGQVLLR